MAQAREHPALKAASMVTAKQINDFLCDENYLAAVEGAREHRLLFITDLSETRVSAFLGWMFRPGEGHGLGDQVVRELLQNAWRQVHSGDWEGPTWDDMGYRDWTPARNVLRSFRDLCVETEYRFGRSDKTGEKNRPVDVFLVSRFNRLAVLIENKFGSAVHSEQLKAYREQAAKHYEGYTRFHIYLDPNLDNRPDDPPHWIPLRYDWLIDIIATRQRAELLSDLAKQALLQVKDYLEQDDAADARGVGAAQLAALVDDHHHVLNEMKRMKALGRHGMLTEKGSSAQPESEILLVEYHQRQRLWNTVFEQMEHLPLLNALQKRLTSSEIRKLNRRIQFRSSRWIGLHDSMVKPESGWAIRLAAWKPEEERGTYRIRSLIDFNPVEGAGASIPPFGPREDALRAVVASLRQFGRKASSEDRWVRLMEKGRLNSTEAAEGLLEEIERMNTAFAKAGLM